MTIKEKIQLFVPPIYFLIKRKIKYGIDIGYKSPSDKQQFYNLFREVNKRYHMPLSAIFPLSQDLSGLDSLSSPNNDGVVNYYGSWLTLCEYADFPYFNLPPEKLTIQHGITYEMLNCEMMHKDYYNLVWSDEVIKMHRKHTGNPYLFAIGSPFFYAKSILSGDVLAKEKKRLGRNLLAFPMHSTSNINKEYDPTLFIEHLHQMKKHFDTVRVCIYWRDVQRGTAQLYQDAGFECVCCGHIADQAFLKRQRALIEIADATTSNALGSHIGYSVYLNKPHWLVPDDFKLVDIYLNEGAEEMEMVSTSSNYREIYNVFLNNPDFVITEEQKKIVDKYWGTSCIKTPDEIRTLINQAYELSEKL